MCKIEQIKLFVKTKCPTCFLIIKQCIRFFLKFVSIKYKFTRIYHTTQFGGKVSVSGPGSDLIQTKIILPEIALLVKELNVKVFLDAPCGDFYWMKNLEIGLEKYIGVDIVADMIRKNQQNYGTKIREFITRDIIKDELPKVDLILCRDCLVHLSLRDIFSAIKNFKRSKSTYLLTTTFSQHLKNGDIVTGDWRPLNLQLSPFNFQKPIKLINEGYPECGYPDKSLGLWKIEELVI